MADDSEVLVPAVGPYDLALSLRAAASFSSHPPKAEPQLRIAVRLQDRPALLHVRQIKLHPALLRATAVVPADAASAAPQRAPDPAQVRSLAARVLAADLDLRPFYALTRDDRVLGPVTRALRGLKAFRPASLFQMLVIAITEQQISLAAARIQERILQRFGDPVADLTLFPETGVLARTAVSDLMGCGLSRRKAEYVIGVAQAVEGKTLDLQALTRWSDNEVFERLVALRGFGPWSAEYVLVRGLGRPDRVPADDLGVRTVLGAYFADGERLGPEGVLSSLEPFRPYRGVAVFYLLAHHRLSAARALEV